MKKYMRLIGTIVLLFLLAGCTMNVENLSTDSQANTIRVNGVGKASASPDKAELSVSVETEALTAQEASAQNSDRSSAVISAMRNAGVAKKDIETGSFRVDPVYDYRSSNIPKIIGYRVVHSLQVEVNDEDTVGEVIDAAITAGANRIDSVQFTLSDKKRAEMYKEVLGDATKDAEAKADAIADALKLTIKGVKTVSTDYSFTPMYMRDAAITFESTMKAAPPIAPADIDVHATVNVVYEL